MGREGYSLMYGCPSAAGGWALPTSPATTTIVAMYGAPPAEDHGGQSDEPPTVRHVLVELAHRALDVERTAEAGDRSTEHRVEVAVPVDVDAEGVGRLRVLTDGA